MKRKNRLKSLVDYCFICGKRLNKLEDKLGHRINPKKGNSKNNLLFVCSECKKMLQKVPLANVYPNTQTVDEYFKELGKDCKKVIMRKIYNLRIAYRRSIKELAEDLK